jgi:CP family cyanate transporter-like MFS transporter
LGVSLVLIALNLRPVFSSLAALLPEITHSTGVPPGIASLMTTLPVLCLGLFAPFAPGLAQRFGAERTILVLLIVLGLGTALRGLGTVPALLIGAALAGASIAVVNVLLPGLVKRDFPDRLALMTGLFTMALSAGAAAAAGLTVPLEQALGGSWPLALAAWAVPVGLVFLLWAPQALSVKPARRQAITRRPALWRSTLAWQVTLFMGLQSALAYCVFGYLAPILRERGLDGTTAGLVVSVSVISQCVACLLAPAIAVRQADQRLVNVACFALALVGLLACMFAPLSTIWPWATLLGLGQGSLIALAMTAIVLRSPDARVAAQLSSMAQSVGYMLASAGPLLVGVLRGATGSYNSAAPLFVTLALLGAWSSFGAGRAIQLSA